MLRSGASRSVLRSLNTASHSTFKVTSSPIRQQSRSKLCTVSRRPQLAGFLKPLAPTTVSAVRWQSRGDREPVDHVDHKREDSLAEKKIEAHPETVSSTSSIVPPSGADPTGMVNNEPEPPMMSGVMGDLNTIRETFNLEEVPRQAYYMGMAGVVPYAATAIGTVYCSWEINHAAEAGAGFLISEKNAETLLHIIEPLQIGYGAVILSFLGAIHWGWEWAGYGGYHGYPRYAIGVISTAVAWPTILMPVEYALLTQFLAFTFLYYTDVRAKNRGWAPHWYGIYRFVLTFIVGGSIVLSLIGRGQIADRIHRMPSTAERIRSFQSSGSGEDIEEEFEARRRFLPDEEQGTEEDEEDEDDEE